jgi:predicted nucleic acid-binding protein
VRSAIAAGWLKVCGSTPSEPELPDLDEGEAACIRIAPAYGTEALLLMDERAGRTLAIERGLRIAGTVAVIGMAKSRGLIPSAKAVFERLHASDFRIAAEVIRTVLQRVGE